MGFELCPELLYTQKIQIKRGSLRTLNDFQKLLGDIQWLRPYLQLTKGDIRPLEDILKGDANPLSPRAFTPEALQALERVEAAIISQHIGYFSPTQPLHLIVFSTEFSPTALLWQDPVPLLWIHLPVAKRKVLPTYPLLVCQLIILGLKTSTRYFGKEPETVVQPYDKNNLEWLACHHPDWAVLACSYMGKFDTQLPSNKLLQFFSYTPFVFLWMAQKMDELPMFSRVLKLSLIHLSPQHKWLSFMPL